MYVVSNRILQTHWGVKIHNFCADVNYRGQSGKFGHIHHNFRKAKKIWKPLKWGRTMYPCRMYDIARQFPVAHQLVWSRSLQREDGREIVGKTHLYSPRSFTLVTDFLNSMLFFSGKDTGLTFRMKVCAGNGNHRRFKFDHAIFSLFF